MKIGIVGCGNVGSAIAYACVLKGVGSHLVLIDRNMKLAQAQAEDIVHATPFGYPAILQAGQYDDLEDAGIVILTAGVNQKPGETRLDLLKRNAAVFEEIVPAVVRAAPDAIFLIATNPVDIMTAVTARIAARYGISCSRIIGSGTILDTARFRSMLSSYLGVSSHSIHANVIGEHGDSEVMHWSGASIANISLREFSAQIGSPVTDDVKSMISASVRNAANRIIDGKGATAYGIGAGVARLASIIIRDEHAVITCSTVLEQVERVENVCLSLPHVVGAAGIEKTIYPTLDAHEQESLQESAMILSTAMESL